MHMNKNIKKEMDAEEWTYILNLTYGILKWLSRKTKKSEMSPPEKYGSG